MGGGSWTPTSYVSHATKSGLLDSSKTVGMTADEVYKTVLNNADAVYAAASAHDIFTASHVNQALNPRDVIVRESRDSAEHPQSNAIILALDVTGSMGFIAKAIAQDGLPKLMNEIYKRSPVVDPQILFMGFDDIEVSGHFQVSQFESDIRIAEQLQQLWLENGGGGNNYESYSLPWLFAAHKTSIDCYEKRSKKGYLFTIGDEEPTPTLHKHDVERILGSVPQGGLDAKSLLKAAQEKYNVFHIIVDEGNHARGHKYDVDKKWKDLLGDNAIHLTHYQKLAEVIVSTIQIAEGAEPGDVAKSWEDPETVKVVATATKTVKRVIAL